MGRDTWELLVWFAIGILIFGVLVEGHEQTHISICNYAGGNASRASFFSVSCVMSPENPLFDDAYRLDAISDMVVYTVIPFLFLLFWYVSKQ